VLQVGFWGAARRLRESCAGKVASGTAEPMIAAFATRNVPTVPGMAEPMAATIAAGIRLPLDLEYEFGLKSGKLPMGAASIPRACHSRDGTREGLAPSHRAPSGVERAPLE
jgi:hypothetical protein